MTIFERNLAENRFYSMNSLQRATRDMQIKAMFWTLVLYKWNLNVDMSKKKIIWVRRGTKSVLLCKFSCT